MKIEELTMCELIRAIQAAERDLGPNAVEVRMLRREVARRQGKNVAEMKEQTIQPMQASAFDPALAVFPCFLQPKINGVRCLWDGRTAWTKPGNRHIEAIQRLLSSIDLSCYGDTGCLDGELYVDGWSLEQIISAVKREQPLTARLKYYVFDACFDEADLPFDERLEGLELIVGANPGEPLRLVPTLACRSIERLQRQYDRFLDAGYEGLIYRRSGGRYCQGPAGSELMKLKPSEDAEFTIVGCRQGKGRAAGTPVFICSTQDRERFRVAMEGSLEYRRRLWLARNSLMGRPLTVRYQGLTPRGVPRSGVGVAVRDYEDGSPVSPVMTVTGRSAHGIEYTITVHGAVETRGSFNAL